MPPSRPSLQKDILKALLNQQNKSVFSDPAAMIKFAADLAKAIDKYVNSI